MSLLNLSSLREVERLTIDVDRDRAEATLNRFKANETTGVPSLFTTFIIALVGIGYGFGAAVLVAVVFGLAALRWTVVAVHCRRLARLTTAVDQLTGDSAGRVVRHLARLAAFTAGGLFARIVAGLALGGIDETFSGGVPTFVLAFGGQIIIELLVAAHLGWHELRD